jgi:ComF family protein
MKRPAGTPLARVIADLLAERIRSTLASPVDAIVPIPMHWLRRLSRGVNGPELVAQWIAPQLQAKFVRALARCRNTPPQASLSLTARRENMKAAFRIRSRSQVVGRRIVLLDDVMTTCSTCHEAAKTLLSAGAAEVNVAVIARAAPQ